MQRHLLERRAFELDVKTIGEKNRKQDDSGNNDAVKDNETKKDV